MKVEDLRKEYQRFRLNEEDVAPDPIRQFRTWFDQALASQVAEVNAMTLATADADGRPSARIVLLGGFDERGFTFFTNYESRKGCDLAENPLRRTRPLLARAGAPIRIEGRVEFTTAEESDRYFHGRPQGARIRAWASPQSDVIPNRDALESLYVEVEGRHPDTPIPRPPHWGGYRVIPEAIEFWQGLANRLHDRLRYTRRPDGSWQIERLAP